MKQQDWAGGGRTMTLTLIERCPQQGTTKHTHTTPLSGRRRRSYKGIGNKRLKWLVVSHTVLIVLL